MPTYARASTEVHALVGSVLDEWHPELAECKAMIGVVMAYPVLDKDGKPTGPAVTLHGDPCLATIKANPQRDRVDGKPDATITISAPEWDVLANEPNGEEQRRSLIDHELHHLIVRTDRETGRVSTDDQGRPLFEMRKHDWTFTGFRAVAERHGKHSREVIQARQLHDSFGNILFAFASDLAVDPAVRPSKAKVHSNETPARETVTALISVGYSEDEARRLIDDALASSSRPFTSVADLIDAIYAARKAADLVREDSVETFIDKVVDEFNDRADAGTLGLRPDIEAKATRPGRRKAAPAAGVAG